MTLVSNKEEVPKPGSAPFVRNAWYVAAYSREVTPGGLLARQICGQPLVFYRQLDGSPAALYDQCPHRGLPLSKGRLHSSGNISCGYHGFQFGADGACKFIPTQAAVPSVLRVKSFPVVEKWKWLWVWPGDPARADVALIPDHVETLKLLAPGWRTFDIYQFHVKCNYLLALENLLDLQHVYYVHGATAAEADRLDELAREFKNQVSISQDGDFIQQVNDFGEGGRWPVDDLVRMYPKNERYRRILSQAIYPAVSRSEIQFSPTADFSDSGRIAACVAVTPETSNSCHYFSAYTINTDSPKLGEQTALDWNYEVYKQDIAVFEAIQESMDVKGAGACPDISVRADEISIRGRRVLQKMLASEQASQGL
jgi:vanillate O-demethylase monooxygenase subunit